MNSGDGSFEFGPVLEKLCASGGAIGVLGKLILQVTDSLLLRQNHGLQILNLLQQPLKQLRLGEGEEERSGETGKQMKEKDIDREGKGEKKKKKNRSKQKN